MKHLSASLGLILIIGGLIITGCDSGLTGPEPTATNATLSGEETSALRTHRGAVKNFTAPLSGAQEVPAVATNATGLAKFKLSKDGQSLSYKLNVANIENVFMAHIHSAPAGQNGGVVVWLYPENGPPTELIEGRFDGTLAEGTITEDDVVGALAGDFAALVAAIMSGDTYVNVHTTQNPGGEIRGQIDRGNGVASNSRPATQQGPAYQSALARQLNAVREVTKKYRDIETARAAGYGAVSPYVPGMGFHFADGPPFGTDLEDPGVLVYFTNGSYNPAPGDPHDPAHDDDLILGAVEWLVPGDQTANPPSIFDDEPSPRHLKTTEAEGWHFEASEGFTGLHAWVHRGNPEGVFHSTNPTIE